MLWQSDISFFTDSNIQQHTKQTNIQRNIQRNIQGQVIENIQGRTYKEHTRTGMVTRKYKNIQGQAWSQENTRTQGKYKDRHGKPCKISIQM
jgi:hypothetical protein